MDDRQCNHRMVLKTGIRYRPGTKLYANGFGEGGRCPLDGTVEIDGKRFCRVHARYHTKTPRPPALTEEHC